MIKWAFLFRRDGGYGPDSWCGDSHAGDNDDATFVLRSRDDGVTWNVEHIYLSGTALHWQASTSGLEIYGNHPVIYMSAHKHHEYFDTQYNHRDSHYSKWGCNDDVNGRGALVLVDLQSLQSAPRFNNVGEPEHHPAAWFVNDLSKFYHGYSAWDSKNFYSVRPMGSIWMRHAWRPALLAPVLRSPRADAVLRHYPRHTTLTWHSVPEAVRYSWKWNFNIPAHGIPSSALRFPAPITRLILSVLNRGAGEFGRSMPRITEA